MKIIKKTVISNTTGTFVNLTDLLTERQMVGPRLLVLISGYNFYGACALFLISKVDTVLCPAADWITVIFLMVF